VLVELGDTRKAFEHFERALPVHRERANAVGEADTLADLGRAALALGDVEAALGYSRQAVAHWRDLGDPEGRVRGAVRSGAVERERSGLAEGRKLIEEALGRVSRCGPIHEGGAARLVLRDRALLPEVPDRPADADARAFVNWGFALR
jgi:tetratricopeptide (TPR) repeat protein